MSNCDIPNPSLTIIPNSLCHLTCAKQVLDNFYAFLTQREPCIPLLIKLALAGSLSNITLHAHTTTDGTIFRVQNKLNISEVCI